MQGNKDHSSQVSYLLEHIANSKCGSMVTKYLKGYKDEAVNDKDGKQGH